MASNEVQGADYFSSYSELRVHQLMLEDRPRTVTYRRFFEKNRDFVKGKVVMDVGAGAGVLSLFAAAAGAKKVYAVEASSVALLCKEVVTENKFDSIIEVIHDKVENVELPKGTQIDIIVSEWMGFYLLHESMLDSVIYARDKFLAPSGILVPCRACLYVAPVDMTQHFEERAGYWSNMYGFDFSPIASSINMAEVSQPLIKNLEKSCVKSCDIKLLDLNLKTVKIEEVKSFCKNLEFSMKEESLIHGFAFWFKVHFDTDFGNATENDSNLLEDSKKRRGTSKISNGSLNSIDHSGDAKCSEEFNLVPRSMRVSLVSADSSSENSATNESSSSAKSHPSSACSDSLPVVLSTGPSDPPTHWKQTIIFLPQTIMMMDGISLSCKIKMAQDASNKRQYNITLELGDGSELDEEQSSDNDYECAGASDNGEDSDDSTEHPTPCSCGSNRCRLISALMDKYDAEHQKLECEAEHVETEAEVEAAKELDAQIENEGWPMDSSNLEGTDDL